MEGTTSKRRVVAMSLEGLRNQGHTPAWIAQMAFIGKERQSAVEVITLKETRINWRSLRRCSPNPRRCRRRSLSIWTTELRNTTSSSRHTAAQATCGRRCRWRRIRLSCFRIAWKQWKWYWKTTVTSQNSMNWINSWTFSSASSVRWLMHRAWRLSSFWSNSFSKTAKRMIWRISAFNLEESWDFMKHSNNSFMEMPTIEGISELSSAKIWRTKQRKPPSWNQATTRTKIDKEQLKTRMTKTRTKRFCWKTKRRTKCLLRCRSSSRISFKI